MSRRTLVDELVRLITVEGKTALIPVLRNVLAMIRGGMRICFRRSRASGHIEIEVREGVFQGGPLSSALFTRPHASSSSLSPTTPTVSYAHTSSTWSLLA